MSRVWHSSVQEGAEAVPAQPGRSGTHLAESHGLAQLHTRHGWHSCPDSSGRDTLPVLGGTSEHSSGRVPGWRNFSA